MTPEGEALFPKGLKKWFFRTPGILHQEKPERVNEELIAFLKA
jgi:hypothetical protein